MNGTKIILAFHELTKELIITHTLSEKLKKKISHLSLSQSPGNKLQARLDDIIM